MSLRDLFSVKKVLPPISNEQITEDIESVGLLNSQTIQKNRIEFAVDYSTASNFAVYGSAQKYYTDSFARIYEQYPYDGSRKEKIDWENSSSLIDNWIYNNVYPRTTGYAVFSPNGWSALLGSQINGYGEPTTKEYISIKGGPNTNSQTSLVDKFRDSTNQSPKSNVFDITTNRSSNLQLDLSEGLSVEFWLKKAAFNNSNTKKEVIFDLWNNAASSSSGYGRLTLELSGTTGSPFYLTILSGTTGFSSYNIGSNLTTASVANDTWNHYAVTTQNSGSSIGVNFYVNGELNFSSFNGTNINAVSGSFLSNIGSLRTASSGSVGTAIGWGKLSGSVDDFRFWKTARTSKDIGRYWWSNVHGGANSDDANVDLGFYYKFNEGITTTSSVDSIVLDYSGRISNGTWVGYSATSRNTGSAINTYLPVALSSEEPDPIIYSTHSDVVEQLEIYSIIGSDHDATNPNSIFYSFPDWIVNEDNGTLLNITQIMGSYLDVLYLQIKNFTSIKEPYSNVQIDEKPFPFAKNLLDSLGLVTPNLFVDAKFMEEVLSRDEDRTYEDKLNEIKGVIYENIYSNLQAIYKTKGTEKSVRNLLRCFGIDEKLVRLNIYSNNDFSKVSDNLSNTTIKKRSINLNDTDRFQATIYQFSTSSYAESNSYISGSSDYDYVPYTFEVDTIFPKKIKKTENNFFPTIFLTSSIFGAHSAKPTATDLSWETSDYFNFQVFAARPEYESTDATFFLSSSNSAIPTLSSSFYLNVYDNEKWNFAVRLKPTAIENTNIVSGTASGSYTLEFYGASTVGNSVVREFSSSAIISYANGINLTRANKRFYLGAERTNFTGSLIKESDVKFLDFKVWSSYLDNAEIQSHARDTDNFGTTEALKSYYLTNSKLNTSLIPKLETLLVHWNFNQVTGSDNGSGIPNSSDGKFIVFSQTSGSLSYNRYNAAFNTLKKYHYIGRGDYFLQNDNSIIDTQYVFSSRLNEFEHIQNSNLINILGTEEQQTRTRETRPVNYFFSYEKSMYQTISEEMLKMFSTILDYNNLVGNPVNKYRREYKDLRHLRTLFYQNVQNEPDLDKYLDFYKWIDSALGKILLQLVPASADTSDGLLNVIENHALSRNKHQYKFPTMEFKEPILEAGLEGINKHLYDWEHGHRPLSNLESDNCLYWNGRAERHVLPLSSSVSSSNDTRNRILSTTIQALNRSFTTPYRFQTSEVAELRGGINFNKNKKIDFLKIATAPHGPMDADDIFNVPANILFVGVESTSSLLKHCNDSNRPNAKVKYHFNVIHGRDYNTSSLSSGEILKSDIAIPANFISGNVTSGYNSEVNANFMSGVIITNIHSDAYGDSKEIPMQGPFTNSWVGGLQSRHVGLNTGLDDYTTRPEGWKLVLGQIGTSSYEATLGYIGADYPYPEGNPDEPSYPVRAHKRATYYRDFTSKSVYNIKNIQSSTGSTLLGNYERKYQYVHTFGKTNNNRLLRDLTSSQTQTELYGILRTDVTDGRVNFTLPTITRSETIIGNKFSSPGDYRTMSRGYLNLYAEELSPYNAQPFKNRKIIGDNRRINLSLTNDSILYIPEIVSGALGKDLNSLTAIPSGFGGLQSGSTTIASHHKISRNGGWEIEYSGTTTTIKQQFDNGFYSYAIPKTDSQYAWINNSLSSTDKSLPEFQGYLTETIASGSSSYEPILNVVTQSLIGTSGSIYRYGSEQVDSHFIPVDFVGLNAIILDIVNANTNTLGTFQESDYEGGLASINAASLPKILNGILLNRNGPYGYPSFRQIRSKNKIINYLDKTNTLSTINNVGELVSVQEPLIYNNVPITAIIQNNETNSRLEIVFSYENITQQIVNPNLKNIVVTKNNQNVIYNNLITYLINNETYSLVSLSYETQVYPKRQFRTLDSFRKRDSYSFGKWRNNRSDRQQISSSTFSPLDPVTNNIIPTQSVWPLDSRIDMNIPYLSSSVGGEGVLQNFYSTIHNGVTSSITASALYAYKHMLASNTSWTAPSVATRLSSSATFLNTTNGLFDGTAKWQAGDIAGKNPYFDSFADWYEIIRTKYKDYQIIPEYIISQDSNLVSIKNNNIDSAVLNSFEITGSSATDNVITIAYLESNTLDNVDTFKADLNSITKKINLTLNCDALIKLNPKPSFYPVNRTVDLARYFIDSVSGNLSFWTSSAASENQYSQTNVALKNILTPTFAPGLLYNTIKSGIAVDFPILTASLSTTSSYSTPGAQANGNIDYMISNPSFHARIPFEAIYEPEVYLKNIDLIDINPHPSATLNVTSSWNGNFDSIFYKLAMHNFLSEVVDFYSPEGKLTSIISKPETQFKSVTPGKEYRALVKLYKDRTPSLNIKLSNISSLGATTNYTRPQFAPNERESSTMYNRASAFGPPTAGGLLSGSSSTTDVIDSSNGYYSPFTPPYYDGESWALLTYRPSGTVAYIPTVDDIINNVTASYLRYEFNSGTLADSGGPLSYGNLNRNSMQASASLNLFNAVVLDQINLNNVSDNSTIIKDSKVWAIQTKFETPILDFNTGINKDTTDSGNQVNKTFGMWHQYGSLPTKNEGVFLQITDIPNDFILYGGESDERRVLPVSRSLSLTSSLSDIVGFSKEPIKLGQVASSKTIKEAIVAIPYFVSGNEKLYFYYNETSKEYVEFLKSPQAEISPFAKELEVPKSVKDQVSLMGQYILPPALDFMKNDLDNPKAMYIFEFSYTLSQDDLVDIWQGLMPNISIDFAEQTQQITHELNSTEMLSQSDLTEKIQWLVFKVKHKAKNNYNNKLLQTLKSTSGFDKVKSIQSIGRQKTAEISSTEELDYSFNWPYDFVSLVESAKINAKIDFSSIGSEDQTTTNGAGIEIPAISPITSDNISLKTSAAYNVATSTKTPKVDFGIIPVEPFYAKFPPNKKS